MERVKTWERAATLPVLLATHYCPQAVADTLAREGVGFVDLAGNVHLRTPRFWVYLHGGKPTPTLARAARGERGVLAGGAALRVIYALLARPGEEWRMRQLAARAGVALGWTSEIVQALRTEGLARQTKRRGPVTVLKRGPLFDRWVANYGVVLRAQLMLGTYTPVDGTVDDVAARIPKEQPFEGRWIALGGTWGADALTRFYRGPRLVIHAEPPQQRWLHRLRLVPDERGPVTLVAPVAPIMWDDILVTDAGPVAKILEGAYPEILRGD